MIAPSLTTKDAELGILVDLIWRVGSLALTPMSGYARYEWARRMTVFGARTGNYAIILDECIDPA